MQVQSTARLGTQPVSGSYPRMTSSHSASGSRLQATLGRSRPHQRQIITRAENPIEKAAKNVQESAKDLGKELKSNAKDTAEGTEAAYKDANPEEGEKTPKDQYRSTELKNSDKKYTPKSDPKK